MSNGKKWRIAGGAVNTAYFLAGVIIGVVLVGSAYAALDALEETGSVAGAIGGALAIGNFADRNGVQKQIGRQGRGARRFRRGHADHRAGGNGERFCGRQLRRAGLCGGVDRGGGLQFHLFRKTEEGGRPSRAGGGSPRRNGRRFGKRRSG